jgi:hypothetical protein
MPVDQILHCRCEFHSMPLVATLTYPADILGEHVAYGLGALRLVDKLVA